MRVIFTPIAIGSQAENPGDTAWNVPDRIADKLGTFEEYAQELSVLVSGRQVFAEVSEVRPLMLNPLATLGLPEQVLAMLILAFPEVRWNFRIMQGYDDATNDTERGLIRLFHHQFDSYQHHFPRPAPLFDASGMRDWIRRRMIEDPTTGQDASYLPRRGLNALAIDEEGPYAFLHAYTAYRFGFRAVPVDRYRLARFLLGPESPDGPECRGGNPTPSWDLVFEDVFLNFPDGEPGLSRLDDVREEKLGLLSKARHRILVTSGHNDDLVKEARNKAYLTAQGLDPARHLTVLHKPYAGMFKLWRDSGLADCLHPLGRRPKVSDLSRYLWRNGLGGHRPPSFGVAQDFYWPPMPEQLPNSAESGHSSPGILGFLASHLLDRARRIAKDADSVAEALRGAVLATDALELLGGRTPTLAIEALRLKHRLEIKAECLFSGVEHHIALEDRMAEIQRDVEYISSWFGPDTTRQAVLNSEVQILLELVAVLREHNQFDEEEACLERIRDLQRRLWLLDPRNRRNPLGWLAQPAWIYVNWLFGGPSRFLGALLVMFFLGWLMLSLAHEKPERALMDAFYALFTFNPPLDGDNPRLYLLLHASGIVLGVLHLGVLISRLYAWVSRK